MRVSKRTIEAGIGRIDRPHIIFEDGAFWCYWAPNIRAIKNNRLADRFCSKLNKALTEEGI